MQTPAIEIKNLKIGYSGKKAAVTIVASINATLCCGEVVALVGCNGAGKSTLLRTLAGYQPPLSGELLYSGVLAANITPQQLSKKLSVVLTDTPVALNLTVQELVSLGRAPHTGFMGGMRPVDSAAVERAMQAIGITRLSHRKVSALSDGERQKCIIAKALAQETPVIMLDEPTAFLDFPSKVSLLRLLKKLALEMQKAIIVSSHDVELLLRMCDKLWLLDGGSIHCGTPEELSRDGSFKRFIEKEGVVYDEKEKTIKIKD